MSWQERIIAAHLSVTDKVSHGGRLKSKRYFVWQEEYFQDFESDNLHSEQAVHGSTDLFTKTEFDPWINELGAAFEKAGIRWSLNSVQFEEETGFWHIEWYWTVI